MESNQKNIKECDICGEAATSLCFKCVMYLCDTCFKFIHEKNKNKDHKKEQIDYFVPFDLKCPQHKKDRINLFCVDEKGNFKLFNYL